jgi:hypothetical protein
MVPSGADRRTSSPVRTSLRARVPCFRRNRLVVCDSACRRHPRSASKSGSDSILAMLSNFSPGVLANFGPPPVLEPTVSPIGSGGLLWTGKPNWNCSSSSVVSMSLGSARSRASPRSSAFIGGWYAGRSLARCRRRSIRGHHTICSKLHVNKVYQSSRPMGAMSKECFQREMPETAVLDR